MTVLWLALTLGWAVAEARRAPLTSSSGDEGSWLPALAGLTLLGITLWGLMHRDGSAWGAPLLLSGIWLRITALDVLGERFRHHVELLPDHRLETAGPYSWIRHPSELGLLAIGLGTGILLGTPWAGLALLPAIGLRVRAEDRLLVEAFGPPWTAWASVTPALFPWRAGLLGRPSRLG